MSAPVSLNNNHLTRPWPCPIIVTGPTGVGKTSFAVALAEHLDGEIIGADAYQIYDGLPILTAQPPNSFRQRVPHHLIGIIPLTEFCDAAGYARLARERIEDILSRNRIPILTGGTGLYLKALTHGLSDLPPVPPSLRSEISTLPLQEALTRLDRADPAAGSQIDARNPARVRRALEIVLTSGRPLAEAWANRAVPPMPIRGIVLDRDRGELRERIARHVLNQFAAGVEEEVRAVTQISGTAAKAIGFREIQACLRGEIEREACIADIITATRQYAKRQSTWFRNQFDFPILDAGMENLMACACRQLAVPEMPA